MRLPRVVVVTGTGTGVGKTVVTAAVAAAHGGRVALVKPAQTGVTATEPGDVHEAGRLAGVDDLHEWARLPDPLAPDTAARRAGLPLLPMADVAARVRGLSASRDLVLVEGAGGLLVRLDLAGGTVADLARELDAGVLVVTRPGLGALNEAALTIEAIRHRGLTPLGLVIGSWPAEPGLAEQCNLVDLPEITGVPVVGSVPAGAGSLDPAAFRAAAAGWLPGLR